jgi:hypothetical protein
MRVAIIERFSDPSRNCDPDRVGAPRDDTRVLRAPDGTFSLLRRCFRSVYGILADARLSTHDKRKLIVSALATGGAPFAALAGASDAVQLLRSEPFDRIECFSSRDFPLVLCLSRLFGVPYCDYLSDGTRYFGEFAFELLAVIPYAYGCIAAVG